MDISIKRNKDINSTDGIETGSNKEKYSNINAKDNNISKDQKMKETKKPEDKETRIISKEKIYDCDGSGHGYYFIKWSDGTEEYKDF